MSEGKLKVMIVDDHEMVRVGLRTLLELEDDIDVIADEGDARIAIERLPLLRPDVVLMDVKMESLDGITACREVKALRPETHVLMLTSYTDDDAVFSAIMAGASGYVLKNVSRNELLWAIRASGRGETLLDPHVARKITSRLAELSNPEKKVNNADLLSEREKEVLALVAKGRTNKEIALALTVSENTARNHISHILEKLNLSRRSEAAVYAVQKKLVKLDD